MHKEIFYQCNQCEHKAKSTASLIMHKETIHENQGIYCDQCDHKAATENDLHRHTKLSHEENLIKCPQVETNSHRSKAKSKYVSKRIQCPKCDKRFNKNDTFMKHQEKYYEETKNRTENTVTK